jgi:hypothetical protein
VVFVITAGVYFTGAMAFLLLGTAETQRWALPQKSTSSSDESNAQEQQTPLNKSEL